MYDYSKLESKIDIMVQHLATYIHDYDSAYIKNEIFRAYEYARDAHEGQFRLSGDPYIVHPVEASLILLTLKPDIYTIQSCLLHDVIEDTPKTGEDILEVFGEEVAFLCNGMEKLSKVRYRGEDRSIGSLRKMFVAMAQDLRVVFIKLSDRLHNMRTLKHHPKKEKREKIALETLTIYAPIADRLGLFAIKNDLEEECFKILHYDAYRSIKKELKELSASSIAFIENAEKEINTLLLGNVNNYEIDYRIKSIYSIHKKMLKKNLDSAKSLHDLFGIRIMVNDISDCYRVLGLIHNKWSPLPQRFKDYIALPKPNGYKSLHTTIIGLLKGHRDQPTEIQIKTHEMKEYADIGVAAHFEYKERGSKIAKDINWVKELKELSESSGNSDFLSSLKIDVFRHRIFAFTPAGDSINLPAGSTAIDFGYYVHTDLGNHIVMAKVNGQVYPLDKELHNGDVVEIIIDKNKNPNPFWMSFVKTTKAKNRIKAWLKKEDKELHRERGKDIMNKYLEKSGLSPLDKDLSIFKVFDGRENNIEERWRIMEQIGDFSIPPGIILKKILKTKGNANQLSIEALSSTHTSSATKTISPVKKDLIIGGEEKLPYKLCYCSRRKLPEKMVAHINSKGVITIHKRNCKELQHANKDRLLSAYLKGDADTVSFVQLRFDVMNTVGILRTLSDILYSMEINIEAISTEKIDFEKTRIFLSLQIPEYDYLIVDRFIERVKMNIGEHLLAYEVEKEAIK